MRSWRQARGCGRASERSSAKAKVNQDIRPPPLGPGRYVPNNSQCDDLDLPSWPLRARPLAKLRTGVPCSGMCVPQVEPGMHGWAHEAPTNHSCRLAARTLQRPLSPRITSHLEPVQPPNQIAASSVWLVIRRSASRSSSTLLGGSRLSGFPLCATPCRWQLLTFLFCFCGLMLAAALGTLGAAGQYPGGGQKLSASSAQSLRPVCLDLSRSIPICRPIATSHGHQRDSCRPFFPPWRAPSARPDPSSPAGEHSEVLFRRSRCWPLIHPCTLPPGAAPAPCQPTITVPQLCVGTASLPNILLGAA